MALTLALVAAALAWSDPRHGSGGRGPVGISARGAIRIADSRGEKAILHAAALAPGASVAGTVKIENLGPDGRLVLSRARLLETPGPDGGELAPALRLRIRRITESRDPVVYAGPLTAMPTLHLGRLPTGESRHYRFVVRLPDPGFVDDGLMGARVRFDYRWHLRGQ
ncbi:MAG TPA: hypothetical protein VGL02_24590 [Streptomyces sp.]|nr:hypothetical protein [Solirubrobacterales bacterium]